MHRHFATMCIVESRAVVLQFRADKHADIHNKSLSYRRETALQDGLVMAKSGQLELGDNIYGHYRSIFNHCDVFGKQSNRIRRKTQNKGYYAVQGHSRLSRSVPIENPYATYY